ncbi:MAG: sulfatase [Saprospiraceae bacterium]|nr:sulfatase [Saprospiraceae bacterium]
MLQAQPDQPNIVFIIADDVGWNDLGCYGSEVAHTPNIDKIAAEGMRFTNAFLTASSCSPSRCSMISGRYPHNSGAAELHTPLPESQIPFPLLLKDIGYYTVQAGKTHFGEAALRCFDHAYGQKDGGVGAEERWVQCLEERPKNQPFFAWFAAIDAHRDWQIDGYGVTPDPDKIEVPPFLSDDQRTREDLASYHHEISRWDYYTGAVVQELERQGVADNTVIIVTSDNGMPFPRAKTRVYDSGMQAPLIVKWPGQIQGGHICESLVSAVDLAPTIIDMAGLPPYAPFQGKSFRALFTNPDQEFRKLVYSEHNWHDFEAHERMVRSKRYLYVRNHRPNLPNGGPADSKRSDSQKMLDSLRQRGQLSAAQVDIFMSPRPREELFDVRQDPLQIINLASKPELHDTLVEYRMHLQKWTAETKDNVPEQLTPDGFDRSSGDLLPHVPAFNQVGRGEMPGEKTGALKVHAKPGF